MTGFLLFLILVILGAVGLGRVLKRRGITVLSPNGRRQLPGAGGLGRWAGLGLALVLLLILVPASIRVEHEGDRKSTRLNSSHRTISYAVFCLKKKKVDNLIRSRSRSAGEPSLEE